MQSYGSIYDEVNRLATRCLSDAAFKILLNLISRADPYGECFPGIRQISFDISKAKDTVQKALAELQETGCIVYVRRHVRDPLSKIFLPNVYQVSPRVFVTRPELREEADARWAERGGGGLSLLEKYITSKPTIIKELTKDIYSLNQQQQNSPENERSLSYIEGQGQPNGKEKANDKAKTNEAYRTEQEAQAGQDSQNSRAAKQGRGNPEFWRSNRYEHISEIPNRPKLPDVALIKQPLPDMREETLAHRANAELGIGLSLVRGLIHDYTAMRVEAALNYTINAKKLTNPPGFMRQAVQTNMIDLTGWETRKPETIGEGNGRDYISGPYAEFINH